MRPPYFDCNSTTPVEPEVADLVSTFLTEEYGNSASRTHSYGARAKRAVECSRRSVAAIVGAQLEEVVFTSGATESNNLAILGLRDFGVARGRKHIVSTAIEHRAVLEPLEFLAREGYDVTLLKPGAGGKVEAEQLARVLRPDTLLVTVMHVNNETGVIQPIGDIAQVLESHEAFFHVDAAQSFGKLRGDLENKRIDLISVSGHKIYGPKGVGALVVRRRDYEALPLKPILHGGGQERGLRPGTLPVALIVGLGKAAEMAWADQEKRDARCLEIRRGVLDAFETLGAIQNGISDSTIVSTLNVSIPGLDSEAVMVALKDEISISNGSACTSQSYTESHVLKAMGLDEDQIRGALRLSWCHLTEAPDWKRIVQIIQSLR